MKIGKSHQIDCIVPLISIYLKEKFNWRILMVVNQLFFFFTDIQ